MGGKFVKKLLIATLLIYCIPTQAQNYKQEIDKFFTLFEANKKTEAVDSVYSTNPWMTSASDAIQQIKTQFQDIEKIVGNFNGKTLIDETNVKDRFVHVTYIALFDRQPVRMEFQFYRPANDWIIYSFSFDIDFDDDIEVGVRQKIAKGS
jgi:hypothetical protein